MADSGQGNVASRRATYSEVDEVRQRPAHFLSHAWYRVKDNFAGDDKDWVYDPCSCGTEGSGF